MTRTLVRHRTAAIALACISISRTIHCFSPASTSLKKIERSPAIYNSYSRLNSKLITKGDDPFQDAEEPALPSRRALILNTIVFAGGVSLLPSSALAGKAEVDPTGQLFSPKAQMLRGGSDAARGVESRSSAPIKRPQPGQTVQTIYETRFISYLARFLLTFDPASHAWWVKQGFEDSWDVRAFDNTEQQRTKFAEFAESVEVGLGDYFAGPYGSYASVAAAKAGLNAAAPASSLRPNELDMWQQKSLPEKLGFGKSSKPSAKQRERQREREARKETELARQGILNLYALLKARFTEVAAKRQLAILFSFISSPSLQPTAEICSLLGEADNATIAEIEFLTPPPVENEANSRTSCLRGGGYSLSSMPRVEVDSPPALGDDFRQAVCSPVIAPTSRILRINVTDGGEGYTVAPTVTVRQSGARKACEASAILDRDGHVESIIVLSPGYGYGATGKGDMPPEIKIDPPKRPSYAPRSGYRPAKAVAELEYEVVGVKLVEGGNGFVVSEPPRITITPPEYIPDWFVSPKKVYGGKTESLDEINPVLIAVGARVKEMRMGDDAVLPGSVDTIEIDAKLTARLERETLELLPSSVRPVPTRDVVSGKLLYTIPSVPKPPPFVAVPSPRYRAYDPIFGGVGAVPVTKGALELKASEYGRLALAGAICTVLVRTVLNPLELVKTKLQLLNDVELNEYAYRKMKEKPPKESRPSSDPRRPETLDRIRAPLDTSGSEDGSVAVLARETVKSERVPAAASGNEKITIGTMDMIASVVELRGPMALFQSADITFLASVVFGSFGFGATELFRRAFTEVYFEQTGESGSELILLAAAAIACVITSAAATPFEVLRVRSMGLVESKPWIDVLKDYVEENSGSTRTMASNKEGDDVSLLTDFKPSDLLPLWGGFFPTVSRELPFAVTKFLVFDVIAQAIVAFANTQAGEGAMPVQVGVGVTGLVISAFSGAIAGVAGAFVSHPADLILTLTSASKSKGDEEKADEKDDWRELVKELLSREGGVANLFVGLPARSAFFFLVIGLQFFLYDYVKTLFQVSSDDLSLVLDVFYAIRQGLVVQVGQL